MEKSIKTGPIGPTLVRLSLPVLAGQTFNLLYNIVDTWFIARIDASDPWLVGATGLVFPVFFLFLAMSFGISGGVASLVARAIGADRAHELDRTVESGLFLALAAGAVTLAAIYPFATPLLRLFGGTDRILEYGLEYLIWLLPVVPFLFLSAVFIGILQGEGRSKHIMAGMMLGTVANIVLDPVLIFNAGMGIGGAGLATAAGNAITFAYLLAVFLTRKSRVAVHWKPGNVSFAVIGEILRVGIPQSLMNFLASISFVFYNRIMIAVNPMILTAFTLYSRLEQFALIPIWSLMSGLSAVAGQAAGARDFARLKRSSRTASRMAMAVNGSLLVVFALSSGFLFRQFQSDSRVLDLAGLIVPWMALATFVTVPVFIITTVMSAAGFANRSLALTAVRIYGFNVPACALAAYFFRGQILPVMRAIPIASAFALALAYAVQRSFFRGLESGKLTVRYSAPAEVPAEVPAAGGDAGVSGAESNSTNAR